MKERLLNELEDDYEPAVDPGVIDLKMSIYLLCSWVDSDTGFVRSNGWELYVSTRFNTLHNKLCRSPTIDV